MTRQVLQDATDREIRRRARNRRGRYPKQFPDAHGELSTPFGAIVDGYQIREFGIWHRIDRADEIDLGLLNGALSLHLAPQVDAAGAERMWRESIGEMDRTPADERVWVSDE